jgi:hypothetical protein
MVHNDCGSVNIASLDLFQKLFSCCAICGVLTIFTFLLGQFTVVLFCSGGEKQTGYAVMGLSFRGFDA